MVFVDNFALNNTLQSSGSLVKLVTTLDSQSRGKSSNLLRVTTGKVALNGQSLAVSLKTAICRYSLTVRISACHAEGVGSIPITCSSAVAGQRRVQKAT